MCHCGSSARIRATRFRRERTLLPVWAGFYLAVNRREAIFSVDTARNTTRHGRANRTHERRRGKLSCADNKFSDCDFIPRVNSRVAQAPLRHCAIYARRRVFEGYSRLFCEARDKSRPWLILTSAYFFFQSSFSHRAEWII